MRRRVQLIHNKQPLATVPSSLVRSGTDRKLGYQRRAMVLSLSLPAWLGVGRIGSWAAKEEQWSTCEEVIKRERERERWVGKSPEEEGGRECKDNSER